MSELVHKGINVVDHWFKAVCRVPWWGDLILAFAGYIFLHPFAIMIVAAPIDANNLTAFASKQFCKGLAGTAQYVVPLVFLGAAVVSFIVSRKRERKRGEPLKGIPAQ